MAETMVELIQEGKDITTHLYDSEKIRLKECEEVIKKGLNTFLEVGKALAEIHDNRLYRETHKSFKKYCKDVWDLGKSTAHQKIDGFKTVNLLEKKMSAIADVFETPSTDNPPEQEIILPINEAQTRPLTTLKNPDDQVRAWVIVREKLKQDPKAKLTAALIKKVVKEVKGTVVKKEVKKARKAVESTARLSTIFKKQYQVLLDIVSEARNNQWKTMSQAEVAKHLKALIKIVESED